MPFKKYQNMAYESLSEIKEHHLIPLLSDYGFKVSFATDNEFSRKALALLAHLDVPIDKLEYLRNEIEAMTIEARSGIYDVVCKDSHKRIFIIEMQTSSYAYFKERIMFYLFQMYCALVKKGKKGFEDIQSTYCVCIVKDSITDSPKYYQRILLRNDEGEIFNQLVEIHLVELEKFPFLREEHLKIESEFDQLIYTMKYLHTFDTRFFTDFPKFWGERWLNPILTRLDQDKLAPEDKALLEMNLVTLKMLAEEYKKEVELEGQRREKKGLKEGAEKGLKEGAEKERITLLKKVILSEKYSMEEIALLFEVSLDFVMKLKKEME